ncbi:KxYKxGKxW signal peptide domain-containing protein [Levilactobacillus suantsaiihabitans]|uniref:LPXTG cell wall anchor domain-containing protein n=1 Tax=Levilactobacillus suantsaiihabitans TaxID=2487722 RepID=A0A4Z0JDP6_9LACO|nr:KxYKxGKxW signal peptide domain-containing protein [Levilactobacillus suantsaiihabitans]TGD19839.1 LPXTG cell wall anchor domain-containing protein [Levilactobacillus suantsaiihabitans]
MRNELGTMKEHYKSYKAGKRWVFACITVMSLGLGLVGAGTTAQADDASGNDASSSNVQPASNLQDKQQVLKTTTSSTTKESDVQNSADNDVDSDNLANDTSNDAANSDQEKDNTGAPQSDADVNASSDKDNVNDEPAPQAPVDDQSGQADDVVDDTPDTVKDESPESNVAGNTDNTTDKIDETGDTDKMAVSDLNTSATYGPARLARTNLMKTATSSIDGVDASVWMPDANLRAAVEYDINRWNQEGDVTVTDANLSENLARLNSLTISNAAGMPTSLEGLQYFTRLGTLEVNGDLPAAGWIDFSFAKNLSIVYITDSALNGVDFPTFFKQTFGNNPELMILSITHSGMTGNLPDITNYHNLQNFTVTNANLTGTLADLGSSTSLKTLMLGYNQLTGNLSGIDNFPNLASLYAADNNLSGDLTDMSHYTGTLYLPDNHLTSGVQNQKGYAQGLSSMDFQTVTGPTYTLTSKNREIDPVAGVIAGVQDATGAIATDDPMIVYNPGTAGEYFKIVTTSNGGFKLQAIGDVPDGDYTLTVINKKTYQYGVNLTFTVKNGEDPADPDTTDPDTKDPDTDTTNPGGTTTPDTTNPDTTPTTPETTTPDTPVTGGDADEIIAPTTDDSATPLTGGDGATIDTTTPTAQTTNQSAGQADRVVKNTTKRNGQPVSLVAKNSARVVRGTKAPVAHQPATANRLAAKRTATPTTLPQTNEQNSAELIAAGVAVALATLGMGVKVRRH